MGRPFGTFEDVKLATRFCSGLNKAVALFGNVRGFARVERKGAVFQVSRACGPQKQEDRLTLILVGYEAGFSSSSPLNKPSETW